MGSVVVENLSKEFGKVRAVNNINLKVNDGEFLVLLGLFLGNNFDFSPFTLLYYLLS